VVRSALSIPPWSDPLQAEVASYYKLFAGGLTEDALRQVIQNLFSQYSFEKVMECVARLSKLNTENPSIRREEYELLDSDQDHIYAHFEARRQTVSPRTKKLLSRLVAIPRLREVRALLGFTRIDAPEMDPTMEVFNEELGLALTTAPLSARQLEWLPAVENLGEGIFLRLNLRRLVNWENQDPVKRRAENLLNTYSSWRQKRGLQALKGQRPRLILLHTLAHMLIRQMSLDCGYSSASLRERIYSDERMAGLLIYTSTPDSDGSLGGLVRQARLVRNPDGSERDNFGRLLTEVMELARTCSSDPLCREHNPRFTERLNGAACHACAMVSETSCEFGNRLLDRGMLVNLPNQPPTGYVDCDE
jgi:hypothetical protein